MSKLVWILAVSAWPSVSFAGMAEMSLRASGGGNSIAVQPGGTFSLDLWLDSFSGAPEGISNFDGRLRASANNVFTIVGRSISGCGPFTSSDQWSTLLTGTSFNTVLAPTSMFFGAAAFSNAGSGSGGNYLAPADLTLPWKLETFTISVGAVLPPNQTVFTLTMPGAFAATTVTYEGGGLDVVNLDTTTNGVTVYVPEPATVLLLASVLPLFRRRSV